MSAELAAAAPVAHGWTLTHGDGQAQKAVLQPEDRFVVTVTSLDADGWLLTGHHLVVEVVSEIPRVTHTAVRSELADRFTGSAAEVVNLAECWLAALVEDAGPVDIVRAADPERAA